MLFSDRAFQLAQRVGLIWERQPKYLHRLCVQT